MIYCQGCGALATSDDLPIEDEDDWYCVTCIDWGNIGRDDVE